MKFRPVRIGITVFLWFTSLLVLAAIITLCFGSLTSMRVVGQKALEVRQVKLPEVEETQRSFINVESLRRLAEVVYISVDPQTRRMARIKAQAMSTESVFTRNSDFYRQSKSLNEQLNELATIRDEEYRKKNQLRELGTSFISSVYRLASSISDSAVSEQLMQSALTVSILKNTMNGTSKEATLERLKGMTADQELFLRVQNICIQQYASKPSLEPLCQRQKEIQTEYMQLMHELDLSVAKAYDKWQGIDEALREMRDVVRTDAEFETKDALTSIENTSSNAVTAAIWMAVAGAVFFIFYLVVLHFILVRPVRWAGRKLLEIQQGNLDSHAPAIFIKELYQVGDLLDRFSVHIAELTSHASQLAEDAAEKKDLEELMSAVFKVSVDGYVVWTPTRKITVNKELLRILGFTDIKDIAKNWEDLGFTLQKDLPELFDKVMKKGFLRKELLVTTANGKQIPFEVSYLPLKRQDGMSVLSYFRDLRQQKLTEEALRSAKNRAEEAAKVKSDFLARMSHEIRTPMNGVLGLTGIALKESPPPSQKRYLEKIQASARILLRVINDILDFSKMESGKFVLESSPFPFSRLLSTVTDLFSSQAEEKGLYFVVESDPAIPEYVVGDELRLSQVLLNLCGNAMKFTEVGGVTVRVLLENEDTRFLHLRFDIIDTGIGMKKKQLSALFKPFSQADSSTTRKYGGTGLGLVISDLLVKMMQGNVSVYSEPDKGSTFSFTVVLEKNDKHVEYNEGEKTIPAVSHEGLNGLRILLAEDNEINQEVALALLEGLGCITVVASNGEEALQVLQQTEVDCILMDIQMPIMDGLTASKIIRQDPRESVRSLPIIAMTAHAMQEDRDKSLEAGMNRHITKPIDVEELRAALLYVSTQKETPESGTDSALRADQP